MAQPAYDPASAIPIEMKLFDSIPMIEALMMHVTSMTQWEKEFIAGLIRIGGSGKCQGWTKAQAQRLVTLYFDKVLRAKLPPEMRHGDDRVATPQNTNTAKADKTAGPPNEKEDLFK